MEISKNKINFIDKALIALFLVGLVLSLYLQFEEFRIGVISKLLNISASRTSHYITMLQVATVSGAIIFFHRNFWFNKLTALGKCLFIFSIFMLASNLILKNFNNPLYYVGTYTSMTLWIYIYLFSYGISRKYTYQVEQYKNNIVFVLAIYTAILFLYNYMTIKAIGIEFNLIESYYLISILPFVLKLPKKQRYIILILAAVCIILAGKRTGFITFIALILIYVLTIGKNLKSKLKIIALGSILLVIMYSLLSHYMGDEINHIFQRISEIEEDGGSGRSEMYQIILNEVLNTDGIEFLFGHGYNEVLNFRGSGGFSAHNEFLEVAYDYGLVGFIIFLSIFFCVYSMSCKAKAHEDRVLVKISLLIFFLISLTSHSILKTTNITFLCMYWGYMDAKNRLR